MLHWLAAFVWCFLRTRSLISCTFTDALDESKGYHALQQTQHPFAAWAQHAALPGGATGACWEPSFSSFGVQGWASRGAWLAELRPGQPDLLLSAQCLPQLREASSASLPWIALTCPATEACRAHVFAQSLYGTSCLPTVQTGSQDRQPHAAHGCPAWQGENKLLMLHKTKMQRNSHGFLKDFTITALSAAHPDSHSQAPQQKLASPVYLSCSMQSTLAATTYNTSSTRYS